MDNIRWYLIHRFAVKFHLELIPKEGSRDKVQGGGRIHLINEEKKVIFYGISADFGAAEKDKVIAALKETRFPRAWEGYKVFYGPYDKLKPEEAWAVAEEVLTVQH